MSSTPDRTLDDPQQTIADLKRQLAERIAERDEAESQKAAMAEVLEVINASPGDLVPVFDAILEKAHALCGAPLGSLMLCDGENLRGAATRGYPSEYVDFLQNNAIPARAPGINARLRAGEPFIHIIDLKDDDLYRHGNPQRRAMVDLGGARTGLVVALRKEGALLGFITAHRQEVRPFSDKQIALLQNFAAQAVIAMENARLITETREALEQQTATAEVLQVINSSPGDLAPVFDAILRKAHSLCGVAHGSLELYDGQNFRAVATHGLPDGFSDDLRRGYPASAHPATRPLIAGEAFTQILDATQQEFPFAGGALDAVRAPTLLCVALRRDDTLLGMIACARREVRPFSDKQIALLQNFAAQAVIAMENARLLGELRERTSGLEEALEYQTATSDVLQVISRSGGEVRSVLDTLVETATRICVADNGLILRLQDDGQYHIAASVGFSPEFTEHHARSPTSPGRGTVTGRVAVEGRVVHIEDAAIDPEYTATRSQQLGQTRTMLGVPLFRDGTVSGVITLSRQRVERFTERQIELVRTFADQAVIAMENARLINETREALERQTATAEVLQVINSSPGDLAPVFDAMLEKAMRLCDASFGELRTYETGGFRLAAIRGVPAPYAEFMTGVTVYGPGTGPARLLEGERVIHVLDLADSDEYRSGEPNRRAIVDLAGARTLIGVSLRKDDALLGFIMFYRQEVHPFTDKQIALLQNFAGQAVIAMENARLITETREALEQQTATAEVLGVINSSPGDLAPVFDAILEKAHTLCGAEHGTLGTYDGDYFRAVASRGNPAAVLERLQSGFHGLENPVTRPLFDGARFVQIPDLGEINHPIPKAIAALGGFRTALLVPLRKDSKLLGHISARRQEVRPFSDKEIALLENFAAQAVIAMENARLLGELRQRTDEVGELNRGLEARVAEQVDELGRVGRLKRFLAPQLAELIVSQGDEKILESHRREIVVVFCDLRGYTAFTETAEPEEVLDFLRQYHGALGPLVSQFEGTLDQFSGDGIMVFFNDPVPCPDPAERAVKMAMAMRSAANTLIADWRERGRDLGFGAGIAQGYATLGQIGFSERSGYTAIGTVCNVAARLCAEAKDGQILLSQLVNVALKGSVATEQLGPLTLKGLTQPVVAYNVPLAAIQPSLRVIEGGDPQSV